MPKKSEEPYSFCRDQFCSKMPELIEDLKGSGRNLHDLDFTLESLEKVDSFLARVGVKKYSTPKKFCSIVAYVGEVVRKETNGSWEMRLNRDGKTWEPWIVSSDFCPVFVPGIVFAEFEEDDGPYLFGRVSSYLKCGKKKVAGGIEYLK